MRLRTGLESELTEWAIPEADEKFFPDAVDMESNEDSMDGNGSKSLSRWLRPSNGGGVSDLCRGEAAYECGGKARCDPRGGRAPDWKAGGNEDRFFAPEGADVTLANSGAIVGDRPA